MCLYGEELLRGVGSEDAAAVKSAAALRAFLSASGGGMTTCQDRTKTEGKEKLGRRSPFRDDEADLDTPRGTHQ